MGPGLDDGKKPGDGAYSCHLLVASLPGLASGMVCTVPRDRDVTPRICSFNKHLWSTDCVPGSAGCWRRRRNLHTDPCFLSLPK